MADRMFGACVTLTWDLVDFIQELVFDLVKGIILAHWFGGVVCRD